MLFIIVIDGIIFNVNFIFTFRISDSVTADDKTDSLLRIMNINNYLYGDYICRAANNLGVAEKKINVYGKYCFHKHMHNILSISI